MTQARPAPALHDPIGTVQRATATRGELLLYFLGFLAFALLIYWPAMHGEFQWDDSQWIRDNLEIAHPGGLLEIWFQPSHSPQYYPLTISIFWLEYHLWGLNTFGYHMVNVLLHGASAFLVGLALYRLGLRAAWLAGLLFLVHPVQVESVAWIVETKNALSLLFFVLSGLAFLDFAGLNDKAPPDAGVRWKKLPWVYFFFALALFSKTASITLPISLALIYFWKRPKLSGNAWRIGLALVPMVVFGLLLCGLTIAIEHSTVGTKGAPFDFSLPQRILVASRAPWFYLEKLFWPHPLLTIYPRWSPDAYTWWQWLFVPATMLLAAVPFLFHKYWGWGPFVAVAFFIVNLAPVLGFISFFTMFYTFVADHYQYFATIGIFAMLAEILYQLCRRWQKPSTKNVLYPSAASLIVLFFAAISWQQSSYYVSNLSLWDHTAQYNPRSFVVEQNLAASLTTKRRFSEAEAHFLHGIALQPDWGLCYVNYGLMLKAMGRDNEAEQCLKHAIKLGSSGFEPYFPLAQLLVQEEKWSDALDVVNSYILWMNYYPSLTFMDPHAHEIPMIRALALDKLGQTEAAIHAYNIAMIDDPANPSIPYNLATLLAKDKKYADAIPLYQRAIQMDPKNYDAEINLGNCLLLQRNYAQAAEQYSSAIRIDPSNARGHLYLSKAWAHLERMADAQREMEEAIKLDPALGGN